MVELEREGLVKEESELRACGHGGVYRNGSRLAIFGILFTTICRAAQLLSTFPSDVFNNKASGLLINIARCF